MLNDWIESNLYQDPNGEIALSNLYSLFKRSLTPEQQAEWPKARVEQELGARIFLAGRRDQPKKMVKGLTLTAPPINSRTAGRIVGAVGKLVVTPYVAQYDDNGINAVVLTRRDYVDDPESYRLTYAEIATKLQSNGISVDARTVQGAFALRREVLLTHTKDESYNPDEREDSQLEAATIKDDFLTNRRWRREGDENESLPGWNDSLTAHNVELLIVPSYYSTHQLQ